jgi:hypothetical protein
MATAGLMLAAVAVESNPKAMVAEGSRPLPVLDLGFSLPSPTSCFLTLLGGVRIRGQI